VGERKRSAAVLSQSAYIERPILLLVEMEVPLPSRDRGTHRSTDRKQTA
jgi:hypothetical protein